MHTDRVIRACWLSTLLILALPLVVRLFSLGSMPSFDVADFIYDDGYYYLTIAANLADSGRSTLDGITATNGYQPLWLLLLACLAKLVGTDTRTFFIASCALIYAIACITGLLAVLWRRSAASNVALSIAAGFAAVIIQQPTVFLEGLEPILIGPLAVTMVVLIECGIESSRSLLGLSAVLAAAFLVRLDGLSLYATSVICVPLFRSLKRGAGFRDTMGLMLKDAIRLSAFVIPTVCAYAAINQWLFRSAVPVSGRFKSIGGPNFSNWGVIWELLGHWKVFALLIAVLLALELLVRKLTRPPQPLFYRSMAVVSAAVVIQYFYYAALSTWHLWPWYEYLVAVDMALITARIIYLSSLFDWRERKGLIGVAALTFIVVWTAYRGLDFAFQSLSRAAQSRLAFLDSVGIHTTQAPGTISQEMVNLAMINEFFDSRRNTVIAMGDRSGGLAYWGRGKVTIEQTEGLTLGIDYLNARIANTGDHYLEQLPIEYMVVDREVIPTAVGSDGQAQFVVPEPIQGRVTTAPVPTFCFPASAIRYRKRYASGYAYGAAFSTRIAFRFADRLPCSQEALARLRAIETGIGLRQYSLPSEYDNVPGGIFDKQSEDSDRHYKNIRISTSAASRE